MAKQMTKPLAKQIKRHVAYYYDAHPTEEDLMSESSLHKRLGTYLALVLQRHLCEQPCSIYENLGFYQTRKSGEKPLAPDVAVVKGIAFQVVRSWKIGKTGPTPRVVFEIISEETGDKDLGEKPAMYARMGVQEYFAYDPNTPLVKKGTMRRLYGWQRNKTTGQMDPMPVGPDGRLWSQELACFLVPDGEYLRLYNRNGHMLLTGEEAETRRADAEAQAKLAEAKRADAETQAKLAETRRADAETQAKLAETRRANALDEKLRSLGIDPNQI